MRHFLYRFKSLSRTPTFFSLKAAAADDTFLFVVKGLSDARSGSFFPIVRFEVDSRILEKVPPPLYLQGV